MVGIKNKWAIVVAAGRGNRFGGDLPKQFVLVNNKPIIAFSLDVFSRLDYSIIVVIHPDDSDYFQALTAQYHFPKHQVVFGGRERFHSVQNALKLLPDSAELVCVHDAARPNIDTEFIEALESDCLINGNAIPSMTINDSIRSKVEDTWMAVNRADYRIIQTPQFFRASDLKRAYIQSFQATFTDDAAVLEAMGLPIYLSPGKIGNIKMTHPTDLAWMRFLLMEQDGKKNE